MLIPDTARNEISQRIAAVEQDSGVAVIFACESGSRAWGFPSTNSDYDVRFIYVRPVDDYLTIKPVRDVLEQPIVDDYDLSGWDVRKALGLLYKSNPALMEWLSCPIIYREPAAPMGLFRTLVKHAFNPLAGFHHYRSMAKQHISRMSTGESVKLKHYLYTIRPLLACQWILQYGSQPPMLFMDLVDALIPGGEMRETVDKLVALKAGKEEVATIPHNPLVMDFILQTLARVDAENPPPPTKPKLGEFNVVFRQILSEVWG